jgi:hypothetical protein
MVLPVTIIRDNGDRRLAHTLDVTEISARLGGLNVTLQPGELIEIQRGAVKAKFYVYWSGEPGTDLEGQAGVRGIDPNKSIWSTQFPADGPDLSVDPIYLRTEQTPQKSFAAPKETAEHSPAMRYECSGGVNLRAPGSRYPFRAQLKSLHLGGFYVESITTLPLNTVVGIEMQVEGIAIEIAGRVTGSTHRVGMEISFHKASPEIQRKIITVLQKLKQKAWDAEPVPEVPELLSTASLPSAPVRREPALSSADASRVLVTICKMVMADFEHWKSTRTAAEIEELRKTLAELQEQLTPEIALDVYESLTAGEAGNHGQV